MKQLLLRAKSELGLWDCWVPIVTVVKRIDSDLEMVVTYASAIWTYFYARDHSMRTPCHALSTRVSLKNAI